jgi:hypothetical protein
MITRNAIIERRLVFEILTQHFMVDLFKIPDFNFRCT